MFCTAPRRRLLNPPSGVLATTACGDSGGRQVPAPVAHSGVVAEQQGGLVSLSNDVVTIRYDLATGTFKVLTVGGALFLQGAESRAQYQVGEDSGFESGTSDPGSRSWEAWAVDDALGSGVTLAVRHVPEALDAPTLITELELRADAAYVTARVTARWAPEPAEAVSLFRLTPVVADTVSGGALYVGEDPAAHRRAGTLGVEAREAAGSAPPSTRRSCWRTWPRRPRTFCPTACATSCSTTAGRSPTATGNPTRGAFPTTARRTAWPGLPSRCGIAA